MRNVPLLLLLLSCDYEAPVVPARILNAINGDVLFAGEGDPAPTYVTVFDAANPGPPVGTGSPLTFTAVPEEAYSVEGAGLRSAPYAVTRLPDGQWLLNALMDRDGDFNPFSPTLAGATCGDWGGAYLADLLGTQAVLEVSGGRLYDDVNLLIGQEFTTERPAFAFVGAPEIALDGSTPPLFRVRASTVATAFSEDFPLSLGPACAPDPAVPGCDQLPACPCDLQTFAPCGTALFVWMKDADADGVVDPYPASPQAESGVLDIWPRVYLEYTGALDTFDHEGTELPERWVAEAFPLLGEITTVATTNGVPPGQAAAGLGPVGVPFPANELSITFVPAFKHYHAGGTAGEDANGPFDVVQGADGVPTGAWAVTLVSFTGQTWSLPNDIAALGLPSLDPGFEPATQGEALILSR